jgi:ABC-type multidrug transport system fused ATPase/permease subunit
MKFIFNYIKEILYLINESKKKLILLCAFFIFVSIFEVIGIGLIVPYLSLIANPSLVNNEYIKKFTIFFNLNSFNEIIIFSGFALFSVFLLKTFFTIYINKLILSFSERQQLRLRSKLVKSFSSQTYEKYVSRNSAEYIYLVHNQVSIFSSNVILSFLKLISESIVVFSITIILAWSTGLIFIFFILIIFSIVFLYDFIFKNKIKEYSQKASINARLSVKSIQELMNGFKEVRILGIESYFLNKIKEKSKIASKYNLKFQIVTSSPRYFMEFFIIFFLIAIVLYNIFLGKDIQVVIPILGLFGVAALRLLPSLNLITSSITQLRYGRLATKEIHQELKKIISTEALEINNVNSVFKNLELKNITFKYNDLDNLTLNDINLKITEGESIGVIGTSGSGKTTLINLIIGLLNKQSGEILYNGQTLEKFSKTLMSNIAYLPQDIFLLDDTIANNIAFGLDEKDIDINRINESISKAQLESLLIQMPKGINTLIGERGIRLSGGQKQRLAIARAFYFNKSILILDESTSALDNETEKLIVEEIKRLKGSVTMIVIAHRLSTLKYCDRILYLENGKIKSQGPPENYIN